jgi:Ca2+ transporting ATPase
MISLAFSIGAMLKDDCDVKKLASCEIMGGANNICSDKTGTLTNNKMETVQMWCGKDIKVPVKATSETVDLKSLGISEKAIELLKCTISNNVPEKCGPTDLAMTTLLERAGVDIASVRADHQSDPFIRFPFTSGRKRMSTVTKHNEKELEAGCYARIQIKGASEIVCRACSHYIDEQGNRQPKNDEKFTEIRGKIQSFAKQALRTVALAYKDIPKG